MVLHLFSSLDFGTESKNGRAKTRKIARIKFSALENTGFKSVFSIYLSISAQSIILSG